LIAKNNEFKKQIEKSTNHPSILTTQLLNKLQGTCEAKMLLASGYYHPESHVKTNIHVTQEAAHLGVAALDIAHTAAAHSAHQAMPVAGIVLKAAEIHNDHRLIHDAQQLTEQLGNYSVSEREHLYQYVALNTVLTLATRLMLTQDNNELMLEWCSSLLKASITCLAQLQQSNTIVNLAANWSQSVISKFSQPGVSMPFSDQQCTIFNREDLSVALDVQQLFTAPLPTPNKARAVKLQCPMRPYLHPLHQKIYDNVLLSYDWRASSESRFLSFLGGYSSSQLMLLQHYHAALVKALALIDTTLRPLQNNANYALQLHLINTCCYAALVKMTKLMPWHADASQVVSNAAYDYQLVCIEEPLQLQDNQLKMASQITAAWQEVTEANKRTQQAEARATQAETEKEDAKKETAGAKEEVAGAKKETADAKNEENKAKNEVTELKKQLLTNKGVIKDLTTRVTNFESRQNNPSVSTSSLRHGFFGTMVTPDALPKNTQANSYSPS
jgi:hypothetical protein